MYIVVPSYVGRSVIYLYKFSYQRIYHCCLPIDHEINFQRWYILYYEMDQFDYSSNV